MKNGVRLGWPLWAAWGVLSLAAGCNPMAISKCHDEMQSSQEVMLKIDTENLEQVESALAAVTRAHDACVAADRDEEASQVADAKEKLTRQVQGLKEIANRPKKKALTEAELAKLVKVGDPDCPRGQQYEHHQNKQMVKCTGPQIIEMNWEQAKGHFERRGYSVIEKGSLLRLERGAHVYDFAFDKAQSKKGAQCLTIVPDPGVPWEEVVTRATSVHPKKLALDKPVPTKRGPLSLLVEGSLAHVTVKIGDCQPTVGQKPFVPAP